MYIEDENIFDLFFDNDSRLFEKEGKLQINAFDLVNNEYVSQKRYTQCYCRLRGNFLLFIEITSFKTTFQGSEHEAKPQLHLIILNNFAIELREKTNLLEFCLTLNNTKNNEQKSEKYYFLCDSIKERDEWIKSIYLTSFNFLRSLRQALDNELQKNHAFFKNEKTLKEESSNDSKYPQIAIGCDNVLTLCNTTPSPTLYVKIFSRNHFIKNRWQYLGCTELIRSQSPQFSKLITFHPKHFGGIELKFELYNVIEEHSKIEFLIAYAYFNIFYNKNCEKYVGKKFQVPIKNSKTNEFAGRLKFKLINDHFDCLKNTKRSFSMDNLNNKKNDNSDLKSLSLDLIPDIDFTNIQDSCKLFNNPICKRFIFSIYDWNSKFILEEQMQDSQLVFLIPQILLKSYIQDEEYIQNFIGEQAKFLSNCDFYKKLLDFHANNIKSLQNIIKEIVIFMTTNTFRSSKLKKEAYLQFVPINFHKQTCQIYFSQKSSKIRVYSVGTFACHHFGFEKHSWKSFLVSAEQNEFVQVYETWNLLKKLFTVSHNEAKILKYLKDLNNYFNAEEQTFNIEKIELLYKQVHCLSKQLIDLISKNEGELLINQINRLIQDGSNYLEESQLEPIDLIYLNIKACFVDIKDKIDRKKLALNEFEPCNRKLRNAIASLRRTILACYMSSFSQLKLKKEIDFFYQLKFRYLSLVSQALTTLIILIQDSLEDEHFLENVYKTRTVLVLYETLLSCFSEETGMLEDMIYALDIISKNTVIFFTFGHFYDHQSPKSSTLMIPDIDFNSDKICLVFNVNLKKQNVQLGKDVYLSKQLECKVMSLIFNVGVNQQASLPNNIFKKSLQEEVNEVNFKKLKSYFNQFYSTDKEIPPILNDLEKEIQSSKFKNIRILEVACQIVRQLGGIKATCCKSAKDRSSMSITLEEVRFAFKFLNLKKDIHPQLFQTMLDTLRKNGTRIENVYKNIGTKKYAFNYLCLLTFPNDLKPPPGTYSNVDT